MTTILSVCEFLNPPVVWGLTSEEFSLPPFTLSLSVCMYVGRRRAWERDYVYVHSYTWHTHITSHCCFFARDTNCPNIWWEIEGSCYNRGKSQCQCLIHHLLFMVVLPRMLCFCINSEGFSTCLPYTYRPWCMMQVEILKVMRIPQTSKWVGNPEKLFWNPDLWVWSLVSCFSLDLCFFHRNLFAQDFDLSGT